MQTALANHNPVRNSPAEALKTARETAKSISESHEYQSFVGALRQKFPWRFNARPDVLNRDYLRIVDHHLAHLIPLVQPYTMAGVNNVLDFGCGSGGSAIALAMVNPNVHCYGTDIDADEIAVARERARLYNVADRCEFYHVRPCEPLPFPDGRFDFSLCSSVIEYATEEGVRSFCVKEMVRLVRPEGLLFFSVPNRLYPLEIHTRKWGWNYFSKLLSARTIDSSFWEIRKLARPALLELHQTPIAQLFRPWSNFCVRKRKG